MEISESKIEKVAVALNDNIDVPYLGESQEFLLFKGLLLIVLAFIGLRNIL